MMSNAAKSFNILVKIVCVSHNCFDSPTKVFSDLTNVLDTWAKFPW